MINYINPAVHIITSQNGSHGSDSIVTGSGENPTGFIIMVLVLCACYIIAIIHIGLGYKDKIDDDE